MTIHVELIISHRVVLGATGELHVIRFPFVGQLGGNPLAFNVPFLPPASPPSPPPSPPLNFEHLFRAPIC